LSSSFTVRRELHVFEIFACPGLAAPDPVIETARRDLGGHAVAELVGRRDECDVLDRLMADVLAGASRVLVLRGDPGVGKSALLGYLSVRVDGWRVVSARSPRPPRWPGRPGQCWRRRGSPRRRTER
jgi:hypothetical protein